MPHAPDRHRRLCDGGVAPVTRWPSLATIARDELRRRSNAAHAKVRQGALSAHLANELIYTWGHIRAAFDPDPALIEELAAHPVAATKVGTELRRAAHAARDRAHSTKDPADIDRARGLLRLLNHYQNGDYAYD